MNQTPNQSQSSAQTTPTITDIVDMIKQNGGNGEATFMNIAKQKGMSDSDISSFLDNARAMYKSMF